MPVRDSTIGTTHVRQLMNGAMAIHAAIRPSAIPVMAIYMRIVSNREPWDAAAAPPVQRSAWGRR
jgi:hypothetical protein